VTVRGGGVQDSRGFGAGITESNSRQSWIEGLIGPWSAPTHGVSMPFALQFCTRPFSLAYLFIRTVTLTLARRRATQVPFV